MTQELDLIGNTIYADGFVGTADGGIDATNIQVAAGTDGLDAGNLQDSLQAIWTAIAGLS